ncbi:hypothetical protein H6G17_11225 [Chroococcidiopsis sp. FACHB-1243]|uniref:hypothetical protein n=1 Tax=Chroococcidiopsis sp. [FACHB-1243] TaxID=2692781 RepID=UPI001784D539|nr:hypothetical protein [Chroococcidiopsis sp. [FACHB-1243]]MBD2306084.1 hypothetical protein [Chroococcidiopsis sp. [FACHB-1243]]
MKPNRRYLSFGLILLLQTIWLAPAGSEPLKLRNSELKLERSQMLMAKKLTLASGTKLQLELAEELSSKTAQEGDIVVYYAATNVLSPTKEILIKKGARATGKVTEAKRARMFGKKGQLNFTVEEIEAVDGTKIPLRSTVEKNGKGRGATMVAVAALVSVFGVFIKGKNITVKPGTLVEAYVDYDTVVETASRTL